MSRWNGLRCRRLVSLVRRRLNGGAKPIRTRPVPHPTGVRETTRQSCSPTLEHALRDVSSGVRTIRRTSGWRRTPLARSKLELDVRTIP